MCIVGAKSGVVDAVGVRNLDCGGSRRWWFLGARMGWDFERVWLCRDGEICSGCNDRAEVSVVAASGGRGDSHGVGVDFGEKFGDSESSGLAENGSEFRVGEREGGIGGSHDGRWLRKQRVGS